MPVDDSSVEAINTVDCCAEHKPEVTSPEDDDQELLLMIDSELAPSKKRQMLNLLRRYRDISDQATASLDFGNASVVAHRIDTGRSHCIKSRSHRASPFERPTIQDQVSDMITKGVVVQDSPSQVLSPSLPLWCLFRKRMALGGSAMTIAS